MAYVPYQQGLHSASVPGILSMDLQASDTSKVLTGKIDIKVETVKGFTIESYDAW